MTDRPFSYSQELLEACADSDLTRALIGEPAMETGATGQPSTYKSTSWSFSPLSSSELNRESCVILFQQHAWHYGKSPSVTTRIPLSTASPSDHHYEKESENQLSTRFQAFVSNVVFVRNHNNRVRITNSSSTIHSSRHRLTLNQFSDVMIPQQVVPPAATNREAPLNDMTAIHLHRLLPVQSPTTSDLGHHAHDQSWLHFLSSPQQVLDYASQLAIGKGSMHTLDYTKKPHHATRPQPDAATTLPSSTLKIPMHHQHEQFETPPRDDDVETWDGSLLSVKTSKAYKRKQRKKAKHQLSQQHYDDDTDEMDQENDSNSTSSSENVDDQLDQGGIVQEDRFASYLNWATTDNPDGVAIVHPAFDQGLCGSCWAFAAAGSLEASASRREAYNTYRSQLSNVTWDDWTEALESEAVQAAQAKEAEVHELLNLSVQELVDCDHSEQACTGGNPMLAYFFIHRYGLATWEDYPYVGTKASCNLKMVGNPVATVRSWGILPPNHEDVMELALRFIGPIAVGVNGADPSFVAYQGGIFDNPECDQVSNHALLIVGYGQESDPYGEEVRYWIARNSWGPGWGEEGLVRVKRGTGKKGIPGVCGIASNPSVALGGLVVPPRDPGDARVANWMVSHKSILLGLTGLICAFAVYWVLDCEYRRRRRARKRRRRHLHANGCDHSKERGPVESTPLLENGQSNAASYTTST